MFWRLEFTFTYVRYWNKEFQKFDQKTEKILD